MQGLGDPKKNLQYLGSDDKWHDGIEPAKAKVIMKTGASEMSVRYHPELKKWIAVMVDPQIFSDKVILRTSPSLIGPWTDGEVIYRIPILQKSDPKYDADTFCYAGKEHPEFEQPGELLFTYVCNTMKPRKLLAETNIYFPQVVRMPMPDGREEIVTLREHVCRRRECAGRVVSNTASRGRRETLHRHEARAIR